MKKTALMLMIIAILSKVVGFIREITLAYFYGTSGISDAYLIALTIPSVIFAFIGQGISTTYIPLYNNIMHEKDEVRAERFTNNLLSFNFLLCTLIVGLGLIFTESLVKIFASGFTGKTLELAVFFTRITLGGIYFTAAINVFSGYLQIKNNYVIPATIGFPFNFLIILAIAISSKGNLSLLAIGSVLASALQLLWLIPAVLRQGYSFRWLIDFKDIYLKRLFFLALPIIISTSVNQINVLVDRTLASQIVEGGISALNYANRLNLFVHGIVVTSITTVMYPNIAKMAAEKNREGLKKILSKAISGVNLLIIPATVGAMLFSEPIVRLLFGRGVFDEVAVALTGGVLFFYALGMLGAGLRSVLERVFYALQDTKTPMLNATLAVLLNIILNFILAYYLGIGGLALATSIASLFCTCLLFYSLRKKLGAFGLWRITGTTIKLISASLIMGLASRWVYVGLQVKWGANQALLLAMGVGVLVYFFLIYLLKVQEVEEFKVYLQKKLSSR